MKNTYVVILGSQDGKVIHIEADRFILSNEQAAYLFLTDEESGSRETVASFERGSVFGVFKAQPAKVKATE